MLTKTMCLAALSLGDASGYEIKKMVEESFGHFLAVSYGSIYPALSDLKEQGLVECTEVSQEAKPDKKVYSLTPAGREKLQDDLMHCRTEHKVRSEFLFILCFSHLLPPERLEEILTLQVEKFEQGLAKAAHWLNREDVPEGMKFAAGFGQAITTAAVRYIREHQQNVVSSGDGKEK
ncbi:MAG: PadR family transcriptional regulator [Desulfovibrionales bacterium]